MNTSLDGITAETVGDLAALIPCFERSLRAANKSPKTVAVYREAATQLLSFLRQAGMPTEAVKIRREHVESFIEALVATRAPATANNRYRSLTALFNFLIDFGEITDNPMAKMRPPKVFLDSGMARRRRQRDRPHAIGGLAHTRDALEVRGLGRRGARPGCLSDSQPR